MPTPEANNPATLSLLAQLRNQAKRIGYPANLMLQLYVCERFLARIATSPWNTHLILKGGLNLYSRNPNAARPTQDVDLAAQHLPIPELQTIIQEIATIQLPDHVTFDVTTLKFKPILEAATHPGFRAEISARIGRAHEKLVLDVSTGNAITPGPIWLNFPSLLGNAPSSIMGYPLETIFAEKTAAATELQEATTRQKDFYDLHQIATQNPPDPTALRAALQKTFAQRGTPLTECETILLRLSQDARLNRQWQAFLRQNDLQANPNLEAILEPVLTLLRAALP
jgi:predicted nucleotidyltransferase component of viral defense system